MGKKCGHNLAAQILQIGGLAIGVFAGVNLYRGNEKFYRQYLMPLVHLLPPECSHQLAIYATKYNIMPAQVEEDPPILKTKLFGKDLTAPVGIAAGFDKQGEVMKGLQRIGFNIIEVGSVTPNPQLGNPRPRVFRLKEDDAIINRLGMNSVGFNEVFNRIKDIRADPAFANTLIGINIGCNENSPDPIQDYVDGIKMFSSVVDYVVINISCPNSETTQETQKGNMTNLLKAILMARNEANPVNPTPLLIKLSPDLTHEQRRTLACILMKPECRTDGMVISNTTKKRERGLRSDPTYVFEEGGLSGRPLSDMSTKMIAEMYQLTQGTIPIIGTGGVFTGADAFAKIAAGASAVQLYTSFAVQGPHVLTHIKNGLCCCMQKAGYGNMKDTIGARTRTYYKGKVPVYPPYPIPEKVFDPNRLESLKPHIVLPEPEPEEVIEEIIEEPEIIEEVETEPTC